MLRYVSDYATRQIRTIQLAKSFLKIMILLSLAQAGDKAVCIILLGKTLSKSTKILSPKFSLCCSCDIVVVSQFGCWEVGLVGRLIQSGYERFDSIKRKLLFSPTTWITMKHKPDRSIQQSVLNNNLVQQICWPTK